MWWSRKWSIAIWSNFQKITVVVAFTKWGNEWCIIRWLQKHSSNTCWTGERNFCARHWLSTRRHYPVWASKIHICVSSPWIFTCVAETRDQSLFHRLMKSVFTATVWNLHAEQNLKLSLPVMIRELHWVSWTFDVRMGSCSPAIHSEWQRENLKKFVVESSNILNNVFVLSQLA